MQSAVGLRYCDRVTIKCDSTDIFIMPYEIHKHAGQRYDVTNKLCIEPRRLGLGELDIG